WNVTLDISSVCNITQVYNSGTWNEAAREIKWQLPNLASYGSEYLNFTANCSEIGETEFIAEGTRDTIDYTSYNDNTNLGCSGSSCYVLEQYEFNQPENVTYEYMYDEIDFKINYNYTGDNLTFASGEIIFYDDNGNNTDSKFTFMADSGTYWANHSIQDYEKERYVESIRNISVELNVDATKNPFGNLTIEQIVYTWLTGKLFQESQAIHTYVKVYDYTPLMQNATLYIAGDDATTTGGWGEEFNFSTMVKDRFGRNITVYAWHKKSTGNYELIDNWTCESCASWTQANFTYDYVSNNISLLDFKFNATNDDGSTELSGFSYTIEKDDINSNTIQPQNDIIINRNVSTVFSIRSYDRDNTTYPDNANGKIWVSIYDIDTFETSPSSILSNDGWINRTITNANWCADESQYYLGPTKHAWKGGT
ncbi:MAG: hypothetical protein KAS12_00820, partial [Candidatus Aenigmarchaeota archaeon]|nr:hypothetical protein [Candidatus Aenigmarchaeota archaeon]